MAEDKDTKEGIPDLGMRGEGIHPDLVEQISDEEREARERRRAIRVLLNLEVDYTSGDAFLFAYITDMSSNGIFIHTNTPEKRGTELSLKFTMPGETTPMEVEGEVMWVNTYRPGDFTNLNPGMGVLLNDLKSGQQQQIRSLIQRIALIEDGDAPAEAAADFED